MQAGFARYGEELVSSGRPNDAPGPDVGREALALRHPAHAARSTRSPSSRLYAAATPQPVQRLEAYRLPDWERQGTPGGCRVPA